LFTQLFFWGFFLLVLFFYSFIYKVNRLRSIYLLLVSLFFYFKTSGVFVSLLVFTICSDYLWGKLIYKSDRVWLRKGFLFISVILNLSLLCYFKYSYFFVESFNHITGTNFQFINHFSQFSNTFFGSAFSLDKLLLPVGVSFFTFQSLSYTIDMYRRKIEPVKNIFDYGFFVCFFPHLVAGPIVKAHDFLYQIYQPYHLSRKEFGMAVFWILNGFSKKIVADYLAVNYIDRIFDNPSLYSGLETVIGVFAYSIQIYMDFSGYTDMAIGLALILGYRLKTNFLSPYKATSVSEFWKRWHISLSSWLQEYLYIPLGGNRSGSIGSYLCMGLIAVFLILLSGKVWLVFVLAFLAVLILVAAYFWNGFRKSLNTNINVMVTMLLGGLWHGSSWLFVIWGGLNGLGLVIHKLWERISPFKTTENYFIKFMLMLLTLSFISFTRIFFRSEDLNTVWVIFDRINNAMGSELVLQVIKGYSRIFMVLMFAYLVHWLPEKWKVKYRDWFSGLHPLAMVIVSLVVILLAYQFISGEMQAFIYFQF
jgi:alginate O-acetyltransferase complex protein AlgI